MQGNNYLYNQLKEISENGEGYKNLFVRNDNKKYFTKTSGFVNCEVRYARAVYCVRVNF